MTNMVDIPDVSPRARRVFFFALVETLCALPVMHEEGDTIFLEVMKAKLDHVTRAGVFNLPEEDSQGAQELFDCVTSWHQTMIEYKEKQSPEERAEVQAGRLLSYELMQILDSDKETRGL